MEKFFGILLFLGFIALVLGLISPKLVMFGSEIKTRKKVLIRYIIVMIVGFIGLAITAPSTDSGSSSKKASNQSTQSQKQDKSKDPMKRANELASAPYINFEAYSRNPDKYKGQDVQLQGVVAQVMEEKSGSKTEVFLRVDLNPNDFASDNVVGVHYTLKSNEERILEKDFVTVQGTFGGIEKMTTVMGKEVQIPIVNAEIVKIQK